MQVEQLVCNRQEQQCTAGAACNLRDGSQRAYLRVEQLHLPSWQKMAREIANCWRPIFSYFCQKPMMETNLSNCWRCSNIARFIVARGRCVVGKVSLLLFPTRDPTMAASACLTLSSSDASGDHGDVSRHFFFEKPG